MEGHAFAQALRLRRMQFEPTPAQKHRQEVEQRAPKRPRQKKLVHPLDEQRARLLLAERDMNIAWMR